MIFKISTLQSINTVILLSFCLFVTNAKCQDYPMAFSGQLLDQYNRPVSDAKILISGNQGSLETYTNQNGQFLFIDSNSQSHPHLQHWQQKGLMPLYGQVSRLSQGKYNIYAQKQGYTQQTEVVAEIGSWDGNWQGCRGNCSRNYLTLQICFQCDDGPVTSQTPSDRQAVREVR